MRGDPSGFVAASAVALAVFCSVARASDPPETVVVTGKRTSDDGTKLDVPLVEVPQAVTVITREDMDMRGVDTVGEAVRYSPGVSADYYGPDGRGFEWIQLRGFGTFDSTYRDGMRVFNYGFSEAYGLESVGIVRGPSSVLYGQTPPGGVINSVSKLPPQKRQGEIEVDIGNRNAYQGQFDIGGPVLGDGAVSAAGRPLSRRRSPVQICRRPGGGERPALHRTVRHLAHR